MTAKPISGAMPLQKTFVTRADERLEHWISDAELNALTQNRDDHLTEIFWGSLGIAGGATIPAIKSLSKIGDTTDPFDWINMIECSIFLISIGVFIVARFLSWCRKGNTKDLVDEIKSRPKVSVISA